MLNIAILCVSIALSLFMIFTRFEKADMQKQIDQLKEELKELKNKEN